MFKANTLQVILFISLIYSSLAISCSKGGGNGPDPDPDPDPTVIYPTNLTLTISIVGKDATHPNGDGTGVINCTASATNAVKYGFRFGTGSEIESTTGNISYTYTSTGTNTYTVSVFAYSSTGHSINKSQEITILVSIPSYNTLVWSDEFSTPGAPDSSKWGYDIGTGQGGWGNNELQYYTNRPENVIIEGGYLKIKTIKESYMGSAYTSARILTKDKYSFKYGKIEFRARVPFGGGTWPALWMLGSDISSVGWPACGEIDVMEHIGNQLNKIYGTLHYPGNSGGSSVGGTVMINNATTEFHIYTVEWNSYFIKFYVDNNPYFTFNNSSSVPFNHNFFIIMNCAIGGNFGGTVDPTFANSTFEIDYVRVYQ